MKQFICFTLVIMYSLVATAQDAEARLKAMNIELPVINQPVANLVHAVRVGKMLYLSGKGPSKPDGTYITGKVGKDLTTEQGIAAARLVAINQLAVLKATVGDLNKIKRIVKVLGMVNCEADFTHHSKVINGFSDVLVEVFGEKGKHARSAVGMCSLPNNMAVEVELIVELK